MPRKRPQEVHGNAKKPTRYDDATPYWMRLLAEEAEEIAEVIPGERRWQTPKRVYLQFSEKDAEKERYRNEIIRKRKAQRAATKR